MDKILIVISTLDGAKRYVGNGRDVKVAVPVGEYILQVEAPGFEAKRQLIKVYRPAVYRSVSLRNARIHGQDDSTLKGSIINYSADFKQVRVRLWGAYGSEVREAKPPSDGSFEFPVDDGFYILLVVADDLDHLIILDYRTLRVSYTSMKLS